MKILDKNFSTGECVWPVDMRVFRTKNEWRDLLFVVVGFVNPILMEEVIQQVFGFVWIRIIQANW